MVRQDVPVLIVGGSLVGLSTALLLGHHGVRALVVEHHRGTAIHPRAAQVSQRTMEILREVGLEQVVRARSSERFVQDGAIVAVESLAGRELAQFIANLNEGVRDVSPTERIFLSQNLLEPLLEARAAELGAGIRFSTDMVSFEQDADGVTASIRSRNSETTETVRARYLVAADGAHSAVRVRLGIPTHGRGTFSHSVTIYFRGNVAPLLRGRNLSVIYVNHPELRGFFRFEQPFDRGFLAINALGDPASPQSDVATGLTEDRCTELVRIALGSNDVAVEIENVMPWDAEANVAARMQDARIFLAGDAAHVMPPNGGFGGNTGVQDAHNLAWKLACVLAGSADVALLDTYGAERQPVGTFTTEQAYSRYVTRTAPYLGTDGIQPVANDLEIELGYAYTSPAICLEPGSNPPHGDPRQSRARPGTRAPHIWIESDGQQVSTLDLFGRSFVLLAGHDGGAWCQAGRDAARRMGVPLDVYRVGADGRLYPESPGSRTAAFGRDERGGRRSNAVPVPLMFTEAYGLSSTGAVIVRPDGFCGWRAVEIQRGGESECSAEVERALERLLCRRPHAAG